MLIEDAIVKKTKKSVTEELAEKGYPLDSGAIDAPFNLTIMPMTSMDVDKSVILDFFKNLTSIIRSSEFKCELRDILIFLKILNSELMSGGEKITWSKRECAYKITKIIDFLEWQNASTKKRKSILVKCITGCINEIPQKHLSDLSKERLIFIVNQAVSS